MGVPEWSHPPDELDVFSHAPTLSLSFEVSSSSLLSLQVLEGPTALSWRIHESMGLKYGCTRMQPSTRGIGRVQPCPDALTLPRVALDASEPADTRDNLD